MPDATAPAQTAPEGEALFTPEGQAAHLASVLGMSKAEAPAEEQAAEPTKEPAKDAAPKDGKEAKARGKDGKFLPKEGDAEKPGKEAAKPAAEPKPESLGSIAKFRRLMQEGKVDEACAIAGIPAEEFAFSSSAWKEVRGVLKEERAAIAAKANDVDNLKAELRHTAQSLVPMAKAMAARERGDIVGCIELATGLTIEKALRQISSLARAGDDVPPAVAHRMSALEQELAATRQERKLEKDARDAQEAAEAKAQGIANWKTQIADAIANSDEPHLVEKSGKRAFLNLVYQKQVESYDRRTRTCLPAIEAAQLAYDELYGEDEAPPQAGQAAKPGPTQRRGTEPNHPAARDRAEGGRKPKLPSHSQAAEASPIFDDVSAPFGDADSHEQRQQRIVERLNRMTFTH